MLLIIVCICGLLMVIAFIINSNNLSHKYVVKNAEGFGKQAVTRLTLIAERSVVRDNPFLTEVISHITADNRTAWILILDPGYRVTEASHTKYVGRHVSELNILDKSLLAQLEISGEMASSHAKTNQHIIFSQAFPWPSLPGQLRSKDVGFVLINLNIKDSLITARINILQESLILFAVSLSIMLIMVLMVFRSIKGSLNKLHKATHQYSSGDFDFRISELAVSELNSLGQSFNNMSQHIQKNLSRQKKTEQGLRILLEHSPAGMISLDNNLQIVFVSRMFSRLTGINSEELTGKDVKYLDKRMRTICASAANYSDIETEIKLFISPHEDMEKYSPPNRISEESVIIKIRNKTLFILEMRIALLDLAMIDEDIEHQYIVSYTDITISSEIERLKYEFITLAAHELRTPMTLVAGYSELIKFMPSDIDQLVKMNDLIYQESQNILLILDDMLDLAHLDSTTSLKLDLRKLNIYRLLEGLIYSEHYVLLRNRIQLLPLDKNLVITADPYKIIKALKHVLDNALKFSFEETPVQIHAEQLNFPDEAGKISITIHDQGIGMDEAQLRQIFTRFYRADMTGKYRGTGLGLSIAKEILILHNATIQVDSQLGRGTKVTMIFDASMLI